MPANHKVSVGWQVVATFIPIVDLWAFYRIRKLRKYVLYIIIPSVVLTIAILASYFIAQPRFTPWGDDGLAFGDPSYADLAQIIGSIIGVGLQGFSIYLIIIWSRQHKRSFDVQPSQAEPPQ